MKTYILIGIFSTLFIGCTSQVEKQVLISDNNINSKKVENNVDRKCTKEDLIGYTWYKTHTRVYQNDVDKSPGSYLSFYLKKVQLVKFLENNDYRTLFGDKLPEDKKTLTTIFELLELKIAEYYTIENGIIKIFRKNTNKQINQAICKYIIKDYDEMNIKKGSIYLGRNSNGKALVGNIYHKLEN